MTAVQSYFQWFALGWSAYSRGAATTFVERLGYRIHEDFTRMGARAIRMVLPVALSIWWMGSWNVGFLRSSVVHRSFRLGSSVGEELLRSSLEDESIFWKSERVAERMEQDAYHYVRVCESMYGSRD